MAVDILSVSALNRTVEAKRDQLREQNRLRDSANQAVLADSAIVDSYNALIDSVDSYITNFSGTGYGFIGDCFHAKYYGSGGQGYGGELCQKYSGIKRLCHYGAITSHISIANQTSRYNCGVCCCITVPAGATYMGVTMTAPGGPGKMANCCGYGGAGPYGHFASFIATVSAGDVFAFCAGCANCCYPYCCGYNLSTAEPTTMCSMSGTYGTGMMVCLTSPSPYGCVEDRNRKWNMIFGKCAGSTSNVGAPYCCQGCCCYTMYWYGMGCLCGNCGTSMCWNGSDWGCFTFNACTEGFPAFEQCYGEIPYQPDRMGPAGLAYCNSTCGDCMPYFNSAIQANIVAGSCYTVKGGWPGGRSCNNCWMQFLPPHPYGVSVLGLYCGCRLCWTNCCPGCLYSPAAGHRCVPGMGGSPTLACGGGTAMYADHGRMGAVCIQFC